MLSRRTAVTIVSTILLALASVAIALRVGCHRPELDPVSSHRAALYRVGGALLQYASEISQEMRYPDRLERLVEVRLIDQPVLNLLSGNSDRVEAARVIFLVPGEQARVAYRPVLIAGHPVRQDAYFVLFDNLDIKVWHEDDVNRFLHRARTGVTTD